MHDTGGADVNQFADFHLKRISDHLDAHYREHIDLTDAAAKVGNPKDVFYTRALAALMVGHTLGCTPAKAGGFVVDGFDDQGLDAIGIAPGHLVVVQSKWSKSGSASLNKPAALATVEGLKYLVNGQFQHFNERVQNLAPLILPVLGGVLRMTVIIVLAGDHPIAADAERPLTEACEGFTTGPQQATVKIVRLKDLSGIVVGGGVDSPVDLQQVTLSDWGEVSKPYHAFHGSVAAEQVMHWYEQHGDRLFGLNIRHSLGRTDVNDRMRTTLTERPQDFWYFNNGITILADEVAPHAFGSFSSSAPKILDLTGVSVVNGAQTVASVHWAMKQHPDIAGNSRVQVRVIAVPRDEERFAVRLTRAANTQNPIQARDFASQQDEQDRLAKEFWYFVDEKIYVVKRGQTVPDAADGCTVEEAAQALVCAHRDPTLAVRAAKNSDLLWAKSPAGFYDKLFTRSLKAEQVWRWVLLLRAVNAAIDSPERRLKESAGRLADLGRHVIAHIVMRRLGAPRIKDPYCDWETEIVAKAADDVAAVVPQLITAVLNRYGDGGYLKTAVQNEDRAAAVVADVLAGVEVDEQDLTSKGLLYRTRAQKGKRRRDSVAILIDRAVIADGTPLEFRPRTGRERIALRDWLTADPRRARATWKNNRTAPIVWAYDDVAYSPSALAMLILKFAGMENRPKAVQGPVYWILREQGSLATYANWLNDTETDPETDLE
ncbi:AIPR family protein [Phytomonospora sp. NPDC050363]|uniref:AIPR family protein n=1 Tax=Phytomonospora sp. NPDC050363 TaxID=3155642 RepID=UPI0033E91462